MTLFTLLGYQKVVQGSETTKKIALVTGASGFVGSNLVRHLNAAGIGVRALMRKTSQSKYLEGLDYQKVEGHLGDLASLKEAVDGVDYVFHLAGVVTAHNRDGYFAVNADGTGRLAQAVAESVEQGKKVSRFVYVSSTAASGPGSSSDGRLESDQAAPVSFYGESKLQGEVEVLKYKDRFPVTVLRPPIVYGPKDSAFFLFIKAVNSRLVPYFKANNAEGNKYYSMVYIDDLCSGMVRAAITPDVASGEVFNLSGDGVYTQSEILDVIGELVDKKPIKFPVPLAVLKTAAVGMDLLGRITRKTYPLERDKVKEIVPDYWVFSNEKAKKILQYEPQFQLRSGMKNAIQWYRKENWI